MTDAQIMRLALRLAQRGYGTTSPNPTVGAVLVKGGKILGRGRTVPQAEIRMMQDAEIHNPFRVHDLPPKVQ
jgi:pyrimidine deaminase RibD-like protein